MSEKFRAGTKEYYQAELQRLEVSDVPKDVKERIRKFLNHCENRENMSLNRLRFHATNLRTWSIGMMEIQLADKILNPSVEDIDSKLCMRNSLRLLEDAYTRGISKQTKLALSELALEESAKALLIYMKVNHNDRKNNSQNEGIDTRLVNSFVYHRVKLQAIKELLEGLETKLDRMNISSSMIAELKRRVDNTYKGMGKKTRAEIGKRIDHDMVEFNKSDGAGFLRTGIRERIAILESLKVDEISDLKNSALYADINIDGKSIVSPRTPDARLSLSMAIITFAIGNLIYSMYNDANGKNRLDKILLLIRQN